MKTLRTALPLLLATVLPAAAVAVDPAPPPPVGAGRAYKLAVLGGFLAHDDVGSPSVQLDVARDATPGKWRRLQLEWHLPIRLGRPHWEGTLTRSVPLPTVPPSTTQEEVGTTEDTVWILEAVPSARLIVPIVPGFSIHVEAGLGLSQTVETHVEDQIYVGRTETRTLELAVAVRAAVGVTYRLGERLDLVLQPAAFGARLGAGESNFSALWGLSYRL